MRQPTLKSGDRFGKLIVVCRVNKAEAVSNGYNYGYWMLKCDCGRYAKAPTPSSLTSGIQTSCGWKCGDRLVKPEKIKMVRPVKPPKVKKPRAVKPPMNLAGTRYGILTAVAIAPRPSGGQGSFWSCRCDCGTTKVVRAKDLRNGNTASCGCLKPRRKKSVLLDLNRPWRKEEHVDDRWLMLLGQRSPVGAGS